MRVDISHCVNLSNRLIIVKVFSFSYTEMTTSKQHLWARISMNLALNGIVLVSYNIIQTKAMCVHL